MAIDVVLTRILGGTRVRTDVTQGVCIEYPEVGKPFIMFAESLSVSGGVRYIATSAVVSVSNADTRTKIIKTQNSTYRLDFTKKEPT